jgi:aminoglycoside 6'-N-acetyltransferase
MTTLRGAHVGLRTMTPDDVEPVTALFEHRDLADAWPGDNAARFRAGLGNGDDSVGMVIELDGRIIGFIQYYEESDPNYRQAAIDVAVHPDFCNRGLGTDALRTLVRHLVDDLGHHRITIDPRATNARAIASYRKVGFRDVGTMRRYELGNDGAWHDALLMDLLRDELT